MHYPLEVRISNKIAWLDLNRPQLEEKIFSRFSTSFSQIKCGTLKAQTVATWVPTITDDVPLATIPGDSDHPGKLSTLVGLFSRTQ